VVRRPQEPRPAGRRPDRGDRLAEEEPVEDGGEFLPGLGGRPLVRRGDAELQRDRPGDPVAGVEGPLVEDPEEGVEDGRRRLEHLVE